MLLVLLLLSSWLSFIFIFVVNEIIIMVTVVTILTLLSIKFQLQTFHIFLLMCICSTHICFAQSQNLKYNINHSLTEFYIYIGMNVFLTDCHRSGGDTGFPPYYLMIFLKAPALKLMPTPMPPPSTYKWTFPLPLPPPLKSNSPFHGMIARKKKQKKSETVIDTCVSLIK